MNTNLLIPFVVLALTARPLTGAPLGTAFTYQGHLNDHGSPANGTYDLGFVIYDSPDGSNAVGPSLVKSDIAVGNGLFTVTLDLGAGLFDGGSRWLDISVRTNGATTFATLAPRQPITPTPYALYAPNAGAATTATTASRADSISASNINGTIALAQLPSGVAVPSGGIILSTNSNDANLIARGYARVAGQATMGDAWQPRAPLPLDGRSDCIAVWTGSEMILWGGTDGSSYFGDGGRYDPVADNWAVVTTDGAPGGRNGHAAVWTGTDMIVWGGFDGNSYLGDGARYDPASTSWSALNTTSTLAGRFGHTAAWTGTDLIIWGGYDGTNATAGAPPARVNNQAVWTGSEMLVCGGSGANSSSLNDTWSYTPPWPIYLYQKP